MCLAVDEVKTDARRAQPEEFVVRYKVVLAGPVFVSSVFHFLYHWSEGVNKPATLYDSLINFGTVSGGAIHVFVHEKDAQEFAKGLNWDHDRALVMKVKCYTKDL